MAPRPITPKPPNTDKVFGARVDKPKRRTGPVRRLENGLLDVTRKAGKHVKTIKSNSQTPLLHLPPELRNRIWEYALGGHRFEVKSFLLSCSLTRFGVSFQGSSPASQSPMALLRVCRQIYAETALLPYKLNSFRFDTCGGLYWVASLQEAQQAVISEICLATEGAVRWLDLSSYRNEPYLTHTLRMDLFPGLSKVVIEVHVPFAFFGLSIQPDHRIKHQMAQIQSHISKAKPGVEIEFKRLDLE